MKLLIVHSNQHFVIINLRIHEVNQNDLQVRDSMLMRKTLGHSVNYLSVLVEKAIRKNRIVLHF